MTIMKWTLALGLAASFPLLGWTRDVDPAHQLQQQAPQKTATSAELERRDLPVTGDDLRILLRADELLKDESVWNRKDDRECDDDEAFGKRSLFCALEKACIEVLGTTDEKKPRRWPVPSESSLPSRSSPRPTWIGVAALADPGFLIEVEATAVLD